MLRLFGFFVLVMVVLQLLRFLPFLGPLFHVPLLGLWAALILVSLIVSKFASMAVDRRTFRRRRLELGAVETPHNQGKLGALMLAAGRAKAAIEPLERANAGEPEFVEWSYRLGCAYLASNRPDDAARSLERAASANEEFAYGDVQLKLAEALRKSGKKDDALAALDRFDKNHGPSPESAYRRAVVLREMGKKGEARASLSTVSRLAEQAARFQKSSARGWVLRSFLLRWI